MFRGLADMHEFAIVPIGFVLFALVLLAMPLVEFIESNDIVVCESRFGGDAEVWRGESDVDLRWQGLCRVTEYHERALVTFRREIDVDGTRFVVRGTARFRLEGDDARVLEIHRAYGSESGIDRKVVLPAVEHALEDAAADPSWVRMDGNYVERKLKDGLEYAMKRVSPTGHVWTAPETRVKLQQELNRRLAATPTAYDIPIRVDLGFVTER